jgi:hypothetical protein
MVTWNKEVKFIYTKSGDIIISIKLKCFHKILSNNSMGYLNLFG